MNTIKCKIDECSSVFTTEEAVSPNAQYICKNHNRAIQVRAAGRTYDPKTDEADQDVHFQTCQFDPALAHAHSPNVDDYHDSDDASDFTQEIDPV